MTRKITIWTFFILTVFLNSCIDRIDISPKEGIELPYINGFLTDEYKFQVIKLGKLIPFSNKLNPPISGANVYILDDNGIRYNFIEYQDEYISEIEFAAEEGVEYTLYIDLNGSTFVSTPQQLNLGQSVESFNYRKDTITIFDAIDNGMRDVEGISLTLNMENDVKDRRYYKYSIDYTYEFQAYILPIEHSLKVCYNTVPTERFRFILHENQASNYSLDVAFIDFSRVFEHGVSFRLTQYSMGKEAFQFWKEVKKLGENTGSIFDTPPYTINGNMVSTNSNDQMRGFFAIYSMKSKRLFLKPEDVNYEYPQSLIDDECFPPRPFWPAPHCYNCLNNQLSSIKTTVKPEYWPE